MNKRNKHSWLDPAERKFLQALERAGGKITLKNKEIAEALDLTEALVELILRRLSESFHITFESKKDSERTILLNRRKAE